PARPGHRYQPVLLQQARDFPQRPVPADEAGQRGREAVHAARQGDRRRSPHAGSVTAGRNRRTAQPQHAPAAGGSRVRPSPAVAVLHDRGGQPAGRTRAPYRGRTWTAAAAGPTIAVRGRSVIMRVTGYSFGSVQVDGVTYDHDLIIDRGKIRKRKKAASRKFRGAYGHTPLSAGEDIPWRCRRLVIGTGANGALPGMQQGRDEAHRPKGDLVVLPTAEAISALVGAAADTNAILHLTC